MNRLFQPASVPIFARSNSSAEMAASPTGELGLKVGQAHMIRPALGADDHRMRALVVSAVDKKPARAARRPIPESDFLLALHQQQLWPRRHSEPPPRRTLPMAAP
jgi:hypothetical protein